MTMASTLKHDIENQLGIILGYCQLLLAELSTEGDCRSDIEHVEGAARRLVAIADGLADATRPSSELSDEGANQLTNVVRSCTCILARLPVTDPLVADVEEMLRAAHAVTHLLPSPRFSAVT